MNDYFELNVQEGYTFFVLRCFQTRYFKCLDMRTYYFGLICYVWVIAGYAQKPMIDTSVFGRWPRVGYARISPDGRYAAFDVDYPGKGHEISVISTNGQWRRSFWNIRGGEFLSDSRTYIFQQGKDSLCALRLGSDKIQFIEHVKMFEVLRGGGIEWLSYKPVVDENDSRLILRQTNTNREAVEDSVASYWYNDKTNRLFIKRKENSGYHYEWVDLASGQRSGIWDGEDIKQMTFDREGRQLAFLTTVNKGGVKAFTLWYYREGMTSPKEWPIDNASGIDSNLMLDNESPLFSRDGEKLFFRLVEKNAPKPSTDGVQVDVWSYRDQDLQEDQISRATSKRTFMGWIDLRSGKLRPLEKVGLRVRLAYDLQEQSRYTLLTAGERSDYWWRDNSEFSIYLKSLENGEQFLLKGKMPYNQQWVLAQVQGISPEEKFVLYYDPIIGDYFSYEITSGITRDVTSGLGINWTQGPSERSWGTIASSVPVGIAGWVKGDRAVLLYDKWDLWWVDLSGIKKPMNLTHGYGRAHHIQLRLTPQKDSKQLSDSGSLLLTAFDTINKYSGYCRIRMDKIADPEILSMGPFKYRDSEKAAGTESWIVKRESAAEAPNYYITKDFKSFRQLTFVAPQKNYNWLQAELVTWSLPNGKPCQGMLFKPENLDPHKKYPLLINYYEEQSDELYEYQEPAATGDKINIPYFASRGYIVFIPDVHPREGAMGESALESVLSGVRFLSDQPWIDTTKIGLQGHSFGGYETNYIITHTHLFKAAMESSGVSDMISDYGSLIRRGRSNQEIFELGQYWMRASPWQRRDSYLNGSPILLANKVTTPLLMMHNKRDPLVPWQQGVEFFTALRRNGKKVWMLQYDHGDHGVQGIDAVDFTIRMEQFFDHYLKAALPPRWMTEGVSASEKGNDNGYELDRSGKIP